MVVWQGVVEQPCTGPRHAPRQRGRKINGDGNRGGEGRGGYGISYLEDEYGGAFVMKATSEYFNAAGKHNAQYLASRAHNEHCCMREQIRRLYQSVFAHRLSVGRNVIYFVVSENSIKLLFFCSCCRQLLLYPTALCNLAALVASGSEQGNKLLQNVGAATHIHSAVASTSSSVQKGCGSTGWMAGDVWTGLNMNKQQ